jgi:LPS-assembly lipoprotein
MPFHTIYLAAPNLTSPFISELSRALTMNKVLLVNSAESAEVVLNITTEKTEKQILTLGGDGHVNEFRLMYHVSIHADSQNQAIIPAEDMHLRRDYAYDDKQILAKEAEEIILYKSMRSDMVQHIIQRLSRSKTLVVNHNDDQH